MSCPRCGFSEPGPVECPRCGVVFAKLERPRPPRRPRADGRPGRGFPWFEALLITVVVAAGIVVVLRWTRPPAPPRGVSVPGTRRAGPVGGGPENLAPEGGGSRTSPADAATGQGPDVAGTQAGPDVVPPAPAGRLSSSSAGRPSSSSTLNVPRPEDAPKPPSFPTEMRELALAAGDEADYRSLIDAVLARVEIDSSHLDKAEALVKRNPGVPEVGRLAEAALELAAQQAGRRGRQLDSVRYRERAAELAPESRGAWLRLVAVHEESGDWRDAELAARRGLSALPDESALHLALARALAQQGRDEDAADVLRHRLASRDDEAARRALAQLERQLSSVAGFARRASAHFDVRFEGGQDATLGSALLKVLEDKYSMLSRTLDFEPDRAIPVVLLPDDTFRTATSAPAWAGAFYSHGDGRIRVRTGDLTAGFVPVDLERTLTHELAHAFIHARTRGAIPDDINEGLAQYLSGKRLGYRLDPSRAAVRAGQMKVDDFYDSALSLVEYLVDRYRQPALNDLLKEAGATGSVDQAFRRTFHQTYDETRAEWLRQLQ
jgi:tetratricopeptide (TPR) repeat protein